MSINFTYVKELESLILDKLLPVYEKFYTSRGVIDPLKDINPKLLEQIKKREKLAALLRPY